MHSPAGHFPMPPIFFVPVAALQVPLQTGHEPPVHRHISSDTQTAEASVGSAFLEHLTMMHNRVLPCWRLRTPTHHHAGHEGMWRLQTLILHMHQLLPPLR